VKITKRTEGEFSGRVEVVVTALDKKGRRLSSKSLSDEVTRKSIRIEETNVSQVYRVIIDALEKEAKGGAQ